MPKEATDAARPVTKAHEDVVATVLSMTLEQRAKRPDYRAKAQTAANTTDDIEDMWDNVPI